MKHKRYWVGIVDGKPYVEGCYDIYGDAPAKRVEAFTSRKDAALRFDVIREVQLVEVAPKKARKR